MLQLGTTDEPIDNIEIILENIKKYGAGKFTYICKCITCNRIYETKARTYKRNEKLNCKLCRRIKTNVKNMELRMFFKQKK